MSQPAPQQIIINCTGRLIRVFDGGRVVRTLPAEEPMLRLTSAEGAADDVDGIPVYDVRQDVAGLPEHQPGVFYIVSQVMALGVLLAGLDRPDILIPGPQVTDRGRVVGCRGLRRLIHTGDR